MFALYTSFLSMSGYSFSGSIVPPDFLSLKRNLSAAVLSHRRVEFNLFVSFNVPLIACVFSFKKDALVCPELTKQNPCDGGLFWQS